MPDYRILKPILFLACNEPAARERCCGFALALSLWQACPPTTPPHLTYYQSKHRAYQQHSTLLSVAYLGPRRAYQTPMVDHVS